MGRKRHSNKITKDADPGDVPKGPPLPINYKPRLIHSLTYQTLVESFLRFTPQDRNVFISMCDYELNTINPQYQHMPEAPTHIMIFAVRLIRSNTCQPIGGLLTYDYEDQSATIADCLRVYIRDLAVLGINVIGTVSQSRKVYKRILSHLVEGPQSDVTLAKRRLNLITKTPNNQARDFASYAITYSVPPFKDLVHIYDFAYITVMFQRQFRHSVVIKFVKDCQMMEASWDDILITLTSTNLFKPHINEALYNNLDIGFNIFTTEFAKKFNACRKKKMLTETQDTTWEIVGNIIKFTGILENERLAVRQFKTLYNSLFDLQKILYGVSFRKNRGIDYNSNTDNDRIEDNELTVSISTSTEDESVKSSDEESEVKKPDFEDDPPIELEDNCMQNILNLIDNSMELKDNIEKHKAIKNASVLLKKRTKGKCDKFLEKSNHPYEKPTINNRKRKTKEELKIDMLEKNFIGIDLHDKENVEKNNERNNVEPPKKNKITNLLMEYLHSEGYKNIEKPEHSCKLNMENNAKDASINNVQIESQHSQLSTTSTEQSALNNVPTPNNTTMENFNFGNFTFDVKNMPDFVENYFCPKTQDSDDTVTDSSETEESIPETKQTNNIDFKVIFTEGSQFQTIAAKDLAGTATEEEAKQYLSCDSNHGARQKCKVCFFKKIKQDDFEEDDVASDWLAVIGGLARLGESLDHRRINFVVPFVFTVEHTDYFVSLVQQKNEVPSSYEGRDYKFLNRESAFQTLEKDVGLYLIKKD